MVRWLPLTNLLLFVALGFGWRAWHHRRRFGESGIVLFRSRRWDQHLRELALLALWALLFAQALAVATDDPTVRTWQMFRLPPIGALVGALLMLGAIALMVVAQLDMGASWRVGIDVGARPGLVVGGLYRVSRNPIYAALLVALLGYSVLVPTPLSLALLAGAAIGLRNQTRSEEAYLLATYGADYAAYAARVGRFLPGIGRLRAPRATSVR